MNREVIFEYLRTFLITIFIVFIAVVIFLAVVQHNVYKDLTQKQIQDKTIDYYLVSVLIEKNKYLKSQYPQNPNIDLKLGLLYEIKKDYKNAESEYLQALAKEPYGEFIAQYRLALLYLKEDRLADAEDIMDKIEDSPEKKLILYKAKIFSKLGDKYYNRSNYEGAIEKYQQSLFYYKLLKSSQIEILKNSLASSYVYLADQQVRQMQIEDARDSLQMAMEIVKAPILKYKMALLLMKDNPSLAYNYFDEVFDKAPELINYQQYNAFLTDMAISAEQKGDLGQSDLYRYKIKRLKEYYHSNILSVDDLSVEYVKGNINYNNWFKNYYINFEFKLKNISKYYISSLYIDIIFKDSNNITIDEYTSQVIDQKSVLRIDALSPIINIRTPKHKAERSEVPEQITVLVYASKIPNGYKVLLTQAKIKEQNPVARTKLLEQKVQQLLHRLFGQHH